MATEPHDQLRRSQPTQLSKEELLRRAKPFEPLPGPLFDDLTDEEEEAFLDRRQRIAPRVDCHNPAASRR